MSPMTRAQLALKAIYEGVAQNTKDGIFLCETAGVHANTWIVKTLRNELYSKTREAYGIKPGGKLERELVDKGFKPSADFLKHSDKDREAYETALLVVDRMVGAAIDAEDNRRTEAEKRRAEARIKLAEDNAWRLKRSAAAALAREIEAKEQLRIDRIRQASPKLFNACVSALRVVSDEGVRRLLLDAIDGLER